MIWGVYILAVLGAIFIIIIAVDFAVFLAIHLPWTLARRFPWTDISDWESSVNERGCKMLNKRSIVPSCDESRFVMWEMLRGRYTHCCLQRWQYAPLVYGLVACGQSPSNDVVNLIKSGLKELDDGFLLFFLNRSGRLSDAELIRFGAQYLSLVEERLSSDGSIVYRKGSSVVFVDSIAFACPLLMRLSRITKCKRYSEIAMKAIRNYSEFGVDERTKLVFHGYEVRSHLPCESLGWGRGTAWYVLGLMYSYEQSLADEDRAFLMKFMLDQVDILLKCQYSDGGWSTKMVRGNCYDSTVTAMLAYYLVTLVKWGIGSKDLLSAAVNRAVDKLMKSTDPWGRVTHAEGDCHDIGNYSRRYGISPLAQGMTILVLAGLRKLKSKGVGNE